MCARWRRRCAPWSKALDPDAVFVFDAPAMFEAFDVLVRLGEAGKTLMAPAHGSACTWQRAGYRSARRADRGGVGHVSAVGSHHVGNVEQLEVLPATADAMRAGKLSRANAEAIASAATVAPGAEAGCWTRRMRRSRWCGRRA
jgi:hypothetical protein